MRKLINNKVSINTNNNNKMQIINLISKKLYKSYFIKINKRKKRKKKKSKNKNYFMNKKLLKNLYKKKLRN